MKKKSTTLDKVTKKWRVEAEDLINGFTSTNDLKKSINAKTERSEQDIKQSLTPLTVLSVLNFLLLLTLVVR